MEIKNTYAPCYPVAAGCNGRLLVVLTNDEAGEYAVYLAIVKDWVDKEAQARVSLLRAKVERITQRTHNDKTDEQRRLAAAWWVAGSGHKLTFKQARHYFPDLKSYDYRR